MARTIKQIQKTLDEAQAEQAGLSELNSPSQTSIYGLWKYITAVCMWIHETLWDKYKAELETTIAAAPIGTVQWVSSKVFEFQYDSTTPQVVELVNFVPAYPVIDETKQIITRCSVKTLPSKIVSVKVAKSEPPEALAAGELSSLQGYLNDISFAGTQYSTVSLSPDYIYIDADITYNGQYASVISATTVTAIETYLKEIPFDGSVRLSTLEDYIQQVPGVIDVVLNNVAIRPNSVAFADKTYIVQGNTTIYNKYPLFAGYVIPESSPNGLADTLSFVTES